MKSRTEAVVRADRQPHGITRRLIVYVVLFSSLITLLITALQLRQEYLEGVSKVKDQNSTDRKTLFNISDREFVESLSKTDSVAIRGSCPVTGCAVFGNTIRRGNQSLNGHSVIRQRYYQDTSTYLCS